MPHTLVLPPPMVTSDAGRVLAFGKEKIDAVTVYEELLDEMNRIATVADHARSQGQSRWVGRHRPPALRPLGIDTLFCTPRGYSGIETDWVVVPADDDPILRAHGDRLPMPRQARRELAASAKIVDFPVLYLAHEVKKGSVSQAAVSFSSEKVCEDPHTTGKHLSQSIDTGVSATRDSVRMALFAERLGAATQRATKRIGAAALATTVGVITLPLLAADIGLDPILIGAVPWRGDTVVGAPAAFFEITRWRY